ncbi:hypothetical protein C0993_010231 [Termitomyces sp. T159_Od127]|nr:hypothetical protein C0993_010231 [Termitomyces sp. T159_Od127]
MPKDPLKANKAGISQLKAELKTHKDNLLAHLASGEKISKANETWLDYAGNCKESNKPSHQEALSAASTILDYVSNMDDQFARKLEAILYFTSWDA